MKKSNSFIIFLFLFSFITRLIVILTINTPIISDFKTMYEASLELINGTNNYKNSIYFINWAYQMGHVVYQSILLSVINNVVFLKIVNAFNSSLTVVFIYLISKKISSSTSSKIVSVLYSIFLFPLLLNTVLTNQILPVLLTLISIYILINLDYEKYIFKSIIIGLILGLANILRSEGIVIIFSILLYSIYLIFKKHNKNIFISFVIIFISYMMIFNISSTILIKTNISTNGLKNMNPTWKFVLGFNYETNGMYSDIDASKYAFNKDESKKIVLERLKEYDKIPMLFLKKSKILWLNSNLSWSIGHIQNVKIYNILSYINQLFIIFFTLLSFVSLFNLKKLDNTQIITTLILITYFFVYLLIEVMPRYAYSLEVFQVILSSIGLDVILRKLNNLHTNS